MVSLFSLRTCIHRLAALLAASAGCAGQDAALRREIAELRREVADLRQARERDRRDQRDLEDRLFLVEDKLDTMQVAAGRASDATPRLPVVKANRHGSVAAPAGPVSPAPAAAPSDAALAPGPGGTPTEASSSPLSSLSSPSPPSPSGGPLVPEALPETLGDETEIEVVYEGEAARETGPRPVIRLHESDRPDDMIPVITSVSPRRAARRRSPLPSGGAVPRYDGERVPEPDAVTERLPVTSTVPRPGDGPIAVYKDAYAALMRREHAVAAAGFERFLARWPEHDYADNSQYWLAESYYDRKQWDRALAEFRQVLRRYPAGNKAPDALLKVGYCYLNLGDRKAARDVLRQVIEIYPKTDAARLARERLDALSD